MWLTCCVRDESDSHCLWAREEKPCVGQPLEMAVFGISLWPTLRAAWQRELFVKVVTVFVTCHRGNTGCECDP